MTDSSEKRPVSSKYLGDLETWIASPEGQRYSCTRQYPHPGYACDYHGATCVGCLIVAAARELRNKAPENETLRVGASDWEEFGLAVRTVSQNCDMTDLARRGDWLQRELKARGFDIVRSSQKANSCAGDSNG